MKYNSKNKPLECMMTQSTCYKGTTNMVVKGILVHSTGANNPNVARYVQPDDNAANRAALIKKIGKNAYNNDWNHIWVDAGLNAWIGKLADGTVAAVQTMPWNFRPWGCGRDYKGSCNDGWIQFECCEDALTNKSYCAAVVEEACQLMAYLCKMYKLDPKGSTTLNGVKVPVILCHKDAFELGLGSNHADVLHWFPKYGYTMDKIRKRVAEIMGEDNVVVEPTPEPTPEPVTPAPSTPTTPSTSALKVGDLVSILPGATYWGGQSIPSWVMNQNWYVYSVGTNGRIVLNQNEKKTSAIMSPVDKKYLKVISAVFEAYKVKITAPAVAYYSGAGTNYTVKGSVHKNEVYTIVEEKTDSTGAKWGKLKSGAGWLPLKNTEVWL